MLRRNGVMVAAAAGKDGQRREGRPDSEDCLCLNRGEYPLSFLAGLSAFAIGQEVSMRVKAPGRPL